MYQDILNKEDITAIKKNINSREQVVALLYQVLNKECKNLLVKIESFEIDFKNFRKRLDWFNCEVSNEEARLRAAGKM